MVGGLGFIITNSLSKISLDKFPLGKGEISERMKIPGNTWQTVWASARPIPAKKQASNGHLMDAAVGRTDRFNE